MKQTTQITDRRCHTIYPLVIPSQNKTIDHSKKSFPHAERGTYQHPAIPAVYMLAH